MPVDSHLSIQDINEFTGGKWDVGNQLMPATAAQVMTDCYGVPGGGLRAFFKPQSFTTTGISNTSQEQALGMFVHENIVNRSGSGQSNDYYLLTYNTSDTRMRLYRMDGTNAATTWTLVKTFAAGLNPGSVPMTAYYTNDGNRYVVFGLGAGGSTDSGVWSVKYSDSTTTKITAAPARYVANYQSRIILNTSAASGALSGTIGFTDPGAFTNIDVNTAPVDPNEGMPAILAMATFSPGDLVVFKEGAPIYLVEGDLTNYTARQMNGARPMQVGGVAVVRGPQGVIFRAGNDGVYETPDGSTVAPLSKNLASSNWQGGTCLAFLYHWLVDAATGLVLDYDTHCWFNMTTLVNGGYVVPLRRDGSFWFANNGATLTLWTLPLEEDSNHRAESYTWKSAPLRQQVGRQLEIRQVEVYARSFNGATSTVAVTVDGVTQTLACDSSGRGGLTYYFRARREELDIQVVAASNASGVEAPTVEAVRVASQGGHYLRPVTDVG